MRFRAIHLRAILLPLGVAVASISAVAWYGLVKIPAQQRYITDRNLRLLKTKSAQIKSKVDNFDLSIDHALEFFPQSPLGLKGNDNKHEKNTQQNDKAYAAQFQEYVSEFAPGLQILDEYESDFEVAMRNRASDPPRVVIHRDEGKNSLYLGYKHAGATIVARSDIEQVLSPFLATGTEFDALVLVTRDGRVIAQQSSSGLELVHVDALRASSQRAAVAADGGQRPDAVGVFESLRASTNIANVILGNAEYQMYIQPVQLSLTAGESTQWRLSADAKAPAEGDMPEEWALCGFVRADHFRAASSSISYTYLLWFGVALITVCVAIPLLKLHMLGASERLHRGDGVRVAATTFVVTALITFCAFDAYYFRQVFDAVTGEKLAGVAQEMRDHFNGEATAIANQFERFGEERLWRALGYADGDSLASYRSRIKPVPSGDVVPTTIRKIGDRAFACVDPLACRDHVLAGSLTHFDYPYFDLVVFDDQAGWQRIKWSTHGVTPFINLDKTQLPYFQQLKLARRMLEARSPDAPRGGVSVIQSPNTGEIQTVFWKAFGVHGDGRDRRSSDLVGESMTTDLISLGQPILPADVQFAVIDRTGRVMFHHDPTRRLQENFFLECENNPALRAAVSGRRPTTLTAYYLGRRYRMHATPLDLSAGNLGSFQDPGWTMVVFQDMTVAETLNVATLAAAVRMFGLYAALLALAWGLVQWAASPRLAQWFWPDQTAGRAYRAVVLVNGALVVLFLVWIARLDSPALLAGTALVVATACVSTLAIVTWLRGGADEPRWLAQFHVARVAFLFVLAAVPAIACFQVAYDFETTLLARSGQAAVAAGLDARANRIRARADRPTLCDEHSAARAPRSSAHACDEALAHYITQRTEAGGKDSPWDLNLSYVVWRDHEVVSTAVPKATTRLEAFLGALHVPYNDVAADMAAVLPGEPARGMTNRRWGQWLETGDNTTVWLAKTPFNSSSETLRSDVARAVPTAGWWWVLAGIAGVLYVLVRVVVQPLYALSLSARRSVDIAAITPDPAVHTLVIGPPGSGKSEWLGRQPMIRVFDARTRAFVDRRVVARAVPLERRQHAYAAFGAGRGFAWSEPGAPSSSAAPGPNAEGTRVHWLDASSLPIERTEPIGIDHLEFSVDHREDRVEMLQFLEELLYRHKRTAWIATARDPITQLQELPVGGPDWSEMARWIRVLKSFTEVRVGLAHPTRRQHGDSEAQATLAAPYYRAVWSACSQREQLALRQLADEGMVNPRNEAVVSQLMRSGLVRRDRTFHVMDEPFRLFVGRALSGEEIGARERGDATMPWTSVTTAMLTIALGLAALLVLTSQQLVDAWVGYVPALAPAVPTVLKFLTAVRHDAKPGVVNV